MEATFKKLAGATSEMCLELPIGPECRALAMSGLTPEGLVKELAERGLLIDAIRALARFLPKREAVWWGCLCARDTLPPDAPPPVAAALKAAETWVYQPSEDNRRAAMACAEAARFETPSSWAAVAAFWSGGSLSPPGNPVVPPGDALTGTAVAGAILLAAVMTQPERADERHRQFLASGLEIARGGTGRPQAAGRG